MADAPTAAAPSDPESDQSAPGRSGFKLRPISHGRVKQERTGPMTLEEATVWVQRTFRGYLFRREIMSLLRRNRIQYMKTHGFKGADIEGRHAGHPVGLAASGRSSPTPSSLTSPSGNSPGQRKSLAESIATRRPSVDDAPGGGGAPFLGPWAGAIPEESDSRHGMSGLGTAGAVRKHWGRVRQAVQTRAFTNTVMMEITQRKADGMALRHRTQARSLEELKATPKHMQGDLSMYTKDNLRKRITLRSHAGITEAIERWWRCVLPDDEALSEEYKSSKQVITKAQYLRMNCCIQLALIPGGKGTPDLDSAEDDWVNDAHGAAEMNALAFHDAIFELADVWCSGVVAQEYIDFLDKVLRAATRWPPWPPTEFRAYKEVVCVYDDDYVDPVPLPASPRKAPPKEKDKSPPKEREGRDGREGGDVKIKSSVGDIVTWGDREASARAAVAPPTPRAAQAVTAEAKPKADKTVKADRPAKEAKPPKEVDIIITAEMLRDKAKLLELLRSLVPLPEKMAGLMRAASAKEAVMGVIVAVATTDRVVINAMMHVTAANVAAFEMLLRVMEATPAQMAMLIAAARDDPEIMRALALAAARDAKHMATVLFAAAADHSLLRALLLAASTDPRALAALIAAAARDPSLCAALLAVAGGDFALMATIVGAATRGGAGVMASFFAAASAAGEATLELFLAAAARTPGAMALLLAGAAKDKAMMAALLDAARSNPAVMAALLIAGGGNAAHMTALMTACAADPSLMALLVAATGGNAELMRLVLAATADDVTLLAALMVAVAGDPIAMAAMLRAAAGDPSMLARIAASAARWPYVYIDVATWATPTRYNQHHFLTVGYSTALGL